MLTELWSDIRYRVRALVRRADVERELDDELRFHLEREAEKYQRGGLSRAESVRRARIAFGGTERAKEASRDGRGTVLLETVVQDLLYALRGLRARPGFTAGVVLTLALGLGANAAMFGILDRLLFRAPAYLHDAGRVHWLYLARTRDGKERISDGEEIGRLLDFRRFTHTLSNISAFTTFHIAVGEGQAARAIPVAGVSASYFNLFDARPAIGRFFSADDDRMPTGAPVAILSYAYWRSAFGGRADVLGTRLRVGRGVFTVVGVAPRDFVGLDQSMVPAIYLPFTAFAWNMRPEDHTHDYHWGFFEIAVRRAAGVSVAAATADLSHAFVLSIFAQKPGDAASARQVAAQRPHAILGPVQPSRGPNAGPEVKVVTWVSGVALLVLLIACANVANLLLGRALARRREIALRLALGVSRGRLVRQLLTESVLLAVIGGAAGLVVAEWGGALLRRLMLPPGADTGVAIDVRTLLVTAAFVLVAAVLTGLGPIAHALRSNVSSSLMFGSRSATARSSRVRAVLLLFQATLSVVLLVGAGIFVRSLANVRHLHLGYDVDPVLTVTENMRGVTLSNAERAALERRLADAATTVPGVVAATPAPTIPFWAMEGRDLFVTGIDSVSRLGNFIMQAGNPDYFRVMGTRILRGRGFTSSDRATTERVTVVSDGMARALWPGQSAIGKCIRIRADTVPCTRVVGVAEDLHAMSFADSREYQYYVPLEQFDDTVTSMLLVRVRGNAADFEEPVRRALQQLMPGAAYVSTMPLRDAIDPGMKSWQLGATMFVAFGLLALALAAVGLYGVIAYGVAERRREIGVRIALGATRPHVLGLIVRQGVRLVLAGVVLGSVIAIVAGRWAAPLLFDESPRDPLVYGVVAAVLVLVSLAATALPAMAAARVDPNITLRAE